MQNNLVFCNERGRHLYEGSNLKRYRRVLKDANLPIHMTMHDLRHNVATYLQEVLKYPPSFVQALLGHSDPAITLLIYTHLDKQDPSKLRPIMDDLDRLFGEENGKNEAETEDENDSENGNGKEKK